MNVNSNQAAAGLVGILMALSPGDAFSSGTQQLVQLGFASVSYSNNVVLGFGDSPVARQIADANATVLQVSFQNGTLLTGGLAWPALAINGVGSNAVLSWSASSTAFSLATASSLNGNWTNVAAAFSTNGGVISTSLPILTNQAFYRLVNP